MANMHKHPVRGLRGIDGDLWSGFEAAAKATGSDRSATLKAFMEWFVSRSDDVPERPPAGPWSSPSE
ncbi:hypothetical protein OG887_06240 [Streptomyces sp. NBC_00053]|uniref:hypothetical protein n=1 Tax=unclassified Streptomyces TaxID=2593676 RepID=UPI00225ADE09|nr:MULTISPECIES: hypothetical protein [unclassified Streptomyces]MCX5498992.1 hypothetical protein [Streptomyces sp. NBC_00052]MCX5552476.1 hypothetical protein [Streptomyces sp. NBC_00051]